MRLKTLVPKTKVDYFLHFSQLTLAAMQDSTQTSDLEETVNPLSIWQDYDQHGLLDWLLTENPLLLSVRPPRTASQHVSRVREIQELGSDLVHKSSSAFLRLYLPVWQDYGVFLPATSNIPVRYDTSGTGYYLPISLLNIAQKVESRLAIIIQYLHFLKRLSIVKAAKTQEQGPKYAPGHRASSFVVDYTMKAMHVDWNTIDEREQIERRRRYLRENRQARRWLLVALRLSFGILLIPSKTLERKVYDPIIFLQPLTHSTNDESQK